MKKKFIFLGFIFFSFLFFKFCNGNGKVTEKIGETLSDKKIELKTELVKKEGSDFFGLRIHIKNITDSNIELYWVEGKIPCNDEVNVFNPCLSYPTADRSHRYQYGDFNTNDIINRKDNFSSFEPAVIKPMKKYEISVLFQCQSTVSIIEIKIRFNDKSVSGPFIIELPSDK